MLSKIPLPSHVEKKVQQGYPWLFSHELAHNVPAGELVLLVNQKNAIVACALTDSGDIAFRILGKNPQQIRFVITDRIEQAYRYRQSILPPQTNCYRLINGEGDELSGIIVDIYDSTAVLRIYANCWLRYLDIIVDTLSKLPNITRVYRKLGVRNVDNAKGGETLFGTELPDHLLVEEHGIRFLVRPDVGQKTGLFLDQREHRKIIGGVSHGKTVANLFSYNGGFSVYAACGGAKRVYSIDVAPEAIEDAKAIFRLNGINPDLHVFEATDAFRWTPPKIDSLDLLICDPPSLSKGKQSDTNAWNAYTELAKHCAQQISKGSLLATASCTARLSSKEWEKAIQQGIQPHGQWSWTWRSYEPMDHPIHLHHGEGRYLKFALLYKRK